VRVLGALALMLTDRSNGTWRGIVVSMGTTAAARFTDAFDGTFPSDAAGNSVLVGLDVLRGLVAGIDDFVARPQPRWRHHDSVGPALIGSSAWLNDHQLLAAVKDLAGACLVISKMKRGSDTTATLRRLAKLNEQTPGIPLGAFDELRELAPVEQGRPVVVGPYGPVPGIGRVATFRTLGFRKTAERTSPPLVHAKLALLGHLLQWQVDAPGDIEAIAFQPIRLWVSSANFTTGSRRSIEFGYLVAMCPNAPAHAALVYRTDGGGVTWHRTDPGHTMPYGYTGAPSYLAADGTHVVQTVLDDPTKWWTSRDGGASYRQDTELRGLPAKPSDQDGQAVSVAGPGLYLCHDDAAVYRSTDGLTWTRLPISIPNR